MLPLCFLFSLAVVFLFYNLATAQTAYLYFLLVPHIGLELALLYAFHGSLNQVIMVLLSMNAFLVLASLVFNLATSRHRSGTGSMVASSAKEKASELAGGGPS